jgi:surface antigen
MREQIMQHLNGVQSSANTKKSATNIPAANTSSAELCFIATDEKNRYYVTSCTRYVIFHLCSGLNRFFPKKINPIGL